MSQLMCAVCIPTSEHAGALTQLHGGATYSARPPSAQLASVDGRLRDMIPPNSKRIPSVRTINHSRTRGSATGSQVRDEQVSCVREPMTFRPIYLALVVVIFAVEVAIAKGLIPGAFVRHSLGDVLVIVLIHFLARGVTRLSLGAALALSLGIGLVTELLQYIHVAELLGLQKGSLLYVVIGNTFSAMDLLMYLVGGVLAAGVDTLLCRGRHAPDKSSPRTASTAAELRP
jgi:hypothetical protein